MEISSRHWFVWVTLITLAILQTKVTATPTGREGRKGPFNAAIVGGEQSDAPVKRERQETAIGEQQSHGVVRERVNVTCEGERPETDVGSNAICTGGVQPETTSEERSEERRSDSVVGKTPKLASGLSNTTVIDNMDCGDEEIEEVKSLGRPPVFVIREMGKRLKSMFGIIDGPPIKKASNVPPYMMKLYRKAAKAQRASLRRKTNSATKNSSIVRSFLNIEFPGYDMQPDGKMRLYFDDVNIPKDEILHAARLRLTHTVHHLVASALPVNETFILKPNCLSKEDSPYQQRLLVYDILQKPNTTSRCTKLLNSKTLDARKGGVKNFNVLPAINRWISNPQANFGLLIEVVPLCSNSSNDKIPDASHISLLKPADDDQWYKRQPLLIVYTDKKETISTHEETLLYRDEFPANYCRRYPLYVDFHAVGWDDWIVAPAGYEAYYCKGLCSFPLSEKDAPFYAVAQTMINFQFPDRVPHTCCIPTELSDIPFLFLDADKFVLKRHPDMVVQRCGCR